MANEMTFSRGEQAIIAAEESWKLEPFRGTTLENCYKMGFMVAVRWADNNPVREVTQPDRLTNEECIRLEEEALRDKDSLPHIRLKSDGGKVANKSLQVGIPGEQRLSYTKGGPYRWESKAAYLSPAHNPDIVKNPHTGSSFDEFMAEPDVGKVADKNPEAVRSSPNINGNLCETCGRWVMDHTHACARPDQEAASGPQPDPDLDGTVQWALRGGDPCDMYATTQWPKPDRAVGEDEMMKLIRALVDEDDKQRRLELVNREISLRKFKF